MQSLEYTPSDKNQVPELDEERNGVSWLQVGCKHFGMRNYIANAKIHVLAAFFNEHAMF